MKKKSLYIKYLRLIKTRCKAQRKLIEAVKKETLAFVAWESFEINNQIKRKRNGLYKK